MFANLCVRDLDMLATFETGGTSFVTGQAPTRYAVRQVLGQELHKTRTLRDNAARQARFSAGHSLTGATDDPRHPFGDKENRPQKKDSKKNQPARNFKRDFFGRIIEGPLQDVDGNVGGGKGGPGRDRVWVTFHEGLNNAVRKPITLDDFLRVF